jgi:hypothetical protein
MYTYYLSLPVVFYFTVILYYHLLIYIYPFFFQVKQGLFTELLVVCITL